MERGSRFLPAVLLSLTVAGALWCFGFFLASGDAEGSSVVCVSVCREQVIRGEGVFYRAVLPLEAEGAHREFFLSDGERVAKNALLGFVYDTEAERWAGRMAGSCTLGAGVRLSQQEAGEVVRQYALALARRDSAGMLSQVSRLGALTESTASLCREELPAARLLRAGASGLFVSGACPCASSDALPHTVCEVLAGATGGEAGAAGYIVTDSVWYFALPVEETDAGLLCPGESYGLCFPDNDLRAEARLVSLSAETGLRLALFRSTVAPGETLFLASAGAELVLARAEGYLLPRTALEEKEGQTLVRRLWSGGEESVPVTVVWEEADSVLVTSEDLREGSRVVVSGR